VLGKHRVRSNGLNEFRGLTKNLLLSKMDKYISRDNSIDDKSVGPLYWLGHMMLGNNRLAVGAGVFGQYPLIHRFVLFADRPPLSMEAAG
jgi:hypothetical protein